MERLIQPVLLLPFLCFVVYLRMPQQLFIFSLLEDHNLELHPHKKGKFVWKPFSNFSTVHVGNKNKFITFNDSGKFANEGEINYYTHYRCQFTPPNHIVVGWGGVGGITSKIMSFDSRNVKCIIQTFDYDYSFT